MAHAYEPKRRAIRERMEREAARRRPPLTEKEARRQLGHDLIEAARNGVLPR
jgi:hypothetical protein